MQISKGEYHTTNHMDKDFGVIGLIWVQSQHKVSNNRESLSKWLKMILMEMVECDKIAEKRNLEIDIC